MHSRINLLQQCNKTPTDAMRSNWIECTECSLLTTHVNKTQKWVRWVRCLAYDPLICKPTISHTFLYCCRLEVKLSPITAVLQNHLFFSADKEIKWQYTRVFNTTKMHQFLVSNKEWIWYHKTFMKKIFCWNIFWKSSKHHS